jgi:hypothetical protein
MYAVLLLPPKVRLKTKTALGIIIILGGSIGGNNLSVLIYRK